MYPSVLERGGKYYQKNDEKTGINAISSNSEFYDLFSIYIDFRATP